MAYERLLNKGQIPSEEIILAALGTAKALWLAIHAHIRQHYDFIAEPVFFTKTCGWSIRYRKGKKTLCYLFPENEAFTILIVLGKEEVIRADGLKDQLNDAVRSVFETTEQLHDGRWLWIRATTMSDIPSIQLLLAAKIKPRTLVQS